MRGMPGLVSGLRPASPEAASPDALAARIAELSPAATALLRHVDDHGGEGTTGSARRTVSPAEARTPAEELISRRLLVPREGDAVVLPGEVGLALRGGRTTREPVDEVPPLATSSRDAALVARTAAGAAFDVVRRVELLLDHWGVQPPERPAQRRPRRCATSRRWRASCTSTSPARRWSWRCALPPA